MNDEDKELLLELREQITDLIATVADLALLDAIRQGTSIAQGGKPTVSAEEKQAEIFTRLSRMLDRVGGAGA
ncbi:MAG TPA: hypothetical protein VKZ79_12380 [Alphaproteobacteria bacterium]|nr:hypothetical protein [Alphaproteobacteria bacterium]